MARHTGKGGISTKNQILTAHYFIHFTTSQIMVVHKKGAKLDVYRIDPLCLVLIMCFRKWAYRGLD